MMKQSSRFFRRILAALLALAFALALLPAAVFAAEPEPETVVTAVPAQVNPAYADVLTEQDLLTVEQARAAQKAGYRDQYGIFWRFRPEVWASGSGTVYDSMEEAAAALRPRLANRETNITVSFRSSVPYTDDLFREFLYQYCFRHTGNPRYGDVLNRHLAGWGTFYAYTTNHGSYYTIKIENLPLTWYTTYSEEQYVDSRIASLVSQLGLKTSYYSDYDKIKAIYDWIAANVTYDYDHLKNTSYHYQYTIYAALHDGTCVCQGYAQLLYRLALEAGVDARYISGKGYGNGGWENHGWNVVKIDGSYYLADSTWDSQYKQSGKSFRYFLQPLSVFSEDHQVVTSYPDRTWWWSSYVNRIPSAAYDPKPADVPYLTAVYQGWSSADGPAIKLGWGAASKATRYALQYSTDGGSTWEWEGYNNLTISGGTGCTHTHLANNTTYRYRIWALNGLIPCQYYTFSDAVSIGAAPSAVSQLTAKQNNLAADVTWPAAANASTYWLERRVVGESWQTISKTLTGTSYHDTGVKTNTSYVYRIRAVSPYGQAEPTTSATLRIVPMPGAIKNVTTAFDSGKITVKWSTSANASRYVLQRRVNGGAWVTLVGALNATSYTDTDVSLGSTYTYRVRGRNAGGFGAFQAGADALYQTPGAISSLTATAGAARITLKWSASSNAKQYLLQRQENGGAWTTIAPNITGTTYVDQAVKHNSSYLYRVRGRNGGLFGVFRTGTAVKAISGLPGAIASVKTTGVTGKITVTWSASTYATMYVLQRQRNNGTWETLKTNLAGRSYTDTAVAAGGTYRYRVRGRNALGMASYKVGESVKIAALPKPGAIAKVSAGAKSDHVDLVWSVSSGSATYELQRRVNGGAWTNVKTGLTERTYADQNVVGGSSYQYRVRAKNAAGYSAYCSGVTVRVPIVKPGAIASVTATASDGTVTVSWGASANAKTYLLQRSENGGAWTTLAGSLAARSYTDSGVKGGSRYQYRVRGRNGDTFGDFKTGSAVSVPFTIPDTPTLRIATDSSGMRDCSAGVPLAWTSAARAKHYQLERRLWNNGVIVENWLAVYVGTDLSYRDRSVSLPAQPYNFRAEYQIFAINDNAVSDSTSAEVLLYRPPAQVTTVRSRDSSYGRCLSIGWSEVPRDASYARIQRRVNGGSWEQLRIIYFNEGSGCLDRDIADGRTYQYRVAYGNTGDNSGWTTGPVIAVNYADW